MGHLSHTVCVSHSSISSLQTLRVSRARDLFTRATYDKLTNKSDGLCSVRVGGYMFFLVFSSFIVYANDTKWLLHKVKKLSSVSGRESKNSVKQRRAHAKAHTHTLISGRRPDDSFFAFSYKKT